MVSKGAGSEIRTSGTMREVFKPPQRNICQAAFTLLLWQRVNLAHSGSACFDNETSIFQKLFSEIGHV